MKPLQHIEFCEEMRKQYGPLFESVILLITGAKNSSELETLTVLMRHFQACINEKAKVIKASGQERLKEPPSLATFSLVDPEGQVKQKAKQVEE